MLRIRNAIFKIYPLRIYVSIFNLVFNIAISNTDIYNNKDIESW